MDTLQRERLRAQLVLHEALRLQPYNDTRGKVTVLVGYNLTDRGYGDLSKALGRPVTRHTRFSIDDAYRVLDYDIDQFEAGVRRVFPHYDSLDAVRQRVVLDFAFNLGHRAEQFGRAKDALTHAITTADSRIQQAFFTEAAFHMMNSLWARQVDDGLAGNFGRADRLCTMLRTGEDYTK